MLIFFAVVVHLGNAFGPGGHKGAVSRVLPRSNIASGDVNKGEADLLQDLLAAYKAQIKQLDESIKQLDESKQEVVNLWKDKEKQWDEKETRLEGDLLRAKAEAHAVVDMRVLVEIAAKQSFPGMSATAASKELAKLVKVDRNLDNSKLMDDAKAWFEELCEIEKMELNQMGVSKEIADIFHGLSLDAHYLTQNYKTGLYIGGEQYPTRAAVAILILKAQVKQSFTVGPIYYCDENYNVLAQLKDGNVILM